MIASDRTVGCEIKPNKSPCVPPSGSGPIRKEIEHENMLLRHQWSISLTVLLFAVFSVGGVGAGPARAGETESTSGAEVGRTASLADEANLSRSTAGETFEDNSHSIHDEFSRFEGSDHLERDHGLEGEHDRTESEHGGEGERGGGSGSGGGDSRGGDSGGEGGKGGGN